MKAKGTKACKRDTRKRKSVQKIKEPQLAVGEAILFGDYYAQKTFECGDEDWDIHDEERSLLQAACLNAHVPACLETRLAKRFISSLGRLQMQNAWCLLVPSYIGHTREIDLATEAVVAAMESPKAKPSTAARIAYGQALTALRQKIDLSDSSLMTVALLSLYEATMRMHTPAQFSHRYGIAKIMLSRPKQPDGPNELERALLYSDWDRRWRAPAALGIVSPFEDSYWLGAEPRRRHSPDEIVRLRMLTNQLYIRLPRLILYVRRLRAGGEVAVPYLREEAKQLADELLELKDKEAESFMLHGIRIVLTKDHWDVPIVRYSFEYQTLQQMTFATAYWHARLLLMQLCLKIVASPLEISLSQSEEEIVAETKRMLTNVFMSYQYAKTLSMMGHICIAQPLVASFGAISCLDKWQDLPISSVKTWIVLRMNDSWGNWGRSFGSRDFEEINSVLSGGPLEGLLPKAYEEERRLFEGHESRNQV